MLSEITVTVKDSEKRLTKKFLQYEAYQVNDEDETIKKCVDETVKEFGDTAEDVSVKINLEIK